MDDRLYEKFADVSEDHWWFEARRQILREVLTEALAADPTMPAIRDRRDTGEKLSEVQPRSDIKVGPKAGGTRPAPRP